MNINSEIELRLFKYYADSFGEPSQAEIDEFKQLIREVLDEVKPERVTTSTIGERYPDGTQDAWSTERDCNNFNWAIDKMERKAKELLGE